MIESTDKLDINPGNIMLTVDDDTILENFEKAEAENPSPSKVIDDTRIIYSSRELPHPTGDLWGQPVLCDFGEARIGDSHSGLIQPELYRAPEIIFEMEWGSKVDIWSVATLVSIQYYYKKVSMTYSSLGVGLV